MKHEKAKKKAMTFDEIYDYLDANPGKTLADLEDFELENMQSRLIIAMMDEIRTMQKRIEELEAETGGQSNYELR